MLRSSGKSRLHAQLSMVRGGEARIESGARVRPLVREKNIAFAAATAAHLRELVRERSSEPINWKAVEHAREILRIVFAGYESARSGEVVHL